MKRQITLQFELDEVLADKLERTGLFDDPEYWLQTRTTYSSTVAGYLRFIKHEIGSDLTSLLGYANLLRRADISPQQQKMFLSAIEKSSRHFQKILTDLTEVEILEVEGARFKANAVDFEKILQETITYLTPMLTEKNQEIQLALDPLPSLCSTAYHLSRVLEIILINAILYSGEDGVIEITAEQVDDRVHIRIVDSGIGISAEDLEHVFEKFFRSQVDEVQEQSGLGIGLTIARHIVQGHRGDIWLNSAVGVGTTVHLLLPLVET